MWERARPPDVASPGPKKRLGVRFQIFFFFLEWTYNTQLQPAAHPFFQIHSLPEESLSTLLGA